MKFQLCAAVLVLLPGMFVANAQVASHAPTVPSHKQSAPHGQPHGAAAQPGGASIKTLEITGKPVARVNGAVLTDRDLVREEYAIFPYAKTHNGIPKELEPQIRQGALEMIIFEELLYQEAKKLKVTIPPERLAKAEKELRKQFPTQADYNAFLQQETNGSAAELKERIRRSLLIDKMVKTEVQAKSLVTPAEVRAYYDKNPDKFKRPETIQIQSISILPPNETPAVLKEAKQRAEDAYKLAKGAKTYREFGLLAEKYSEDDFRVNMGDHKPQPPAALPPEIVKAVNAMQVGQVSELIKLGNAYTIFRLNAHVKAGKVSFAEAKAQLQSELQRAKMEQIQVALSKKLKANAKIEVL